MAWCNKHVKKKKKHVISWKCHSTEHLKRNLVCFQLVHVFIISTWTCKCYLGFKLAGVAYLQLWLTCGFYGNFSRFKSHPSVQLLLKMPRFLVCASWLYSIGLSSMVIVVVTCICSQDIVTRFAHQSGYHVERRFGWDCHGLPVVWFNIEQKYILYLFKTQELNNIVLPKHYSI